MKECFKYETRDSHDLFTEVEAREKLEFSFGESLFEMPVWGKRKTNKRMKLIGGSPRS